MDSDAPTIMISCAGRQASLVEQFLDATAPGGRVLACDSDPNAAACSAATESFVAPSIDNPAYAGWIVDLCLEESVTLILSLLPEDLGQLELIRSTLEAGGTRLLGIPPSMLSVCLDKSQLAALCDGIELRTPPTWLCSDLPTVTNGAFPLIAKARAGSGSRGMAVLTNRPEAEAFVVALESRSATDLYVLQPQLAGQEYGLDVVNDLNGDYVTTFVRRKLRMRGGETDAAETVSDGRLERVGASLGSLLRHQGPADVDIMRCEDGDYLLDVNPRFGGGYAFSHAAGANLPAVLVAWHVGREPDPAWLAPQPHKRGVRIGTVMLLPRRQ